MKRRKKISPLFIFGALVLLFIVLLILILQEVKRSYDLSREVERLKKAANIVPPYYDKYVFEKPRNLPTAAIKKHDNKVKIPIIMYHYVEYTKDLNDLVRMRLDTSPAVFEGHLRAIKNAGYETYFVKDVPDILSGAIHYSTKSAILTFDDGYKDFYQSVFPLLKKYHVRATVYVIYDYIGRPGFLNDEEIKELIDSDLVEIGSHTLSHVYLKSASQEVARKQISESKKKFEERFPVSIKTIAYPYGAFNANNIEWTKEAGYTAAVSVIPGTMQSFDTILYLSRIRPGLFSPKTMISFLEAYNK